MVEPPAHAIRCLKAWGRRSVWLIQRPGEGPRTVKTWPLTPLRILKMLAGQSQAQRQLRGAHRLAKAGVRTPRPVGSWRIVRAGRWLGVWLELEFVDGRSAYELARRDGIDLGFGRRCACRIGRAVRALAEARIVHRDLKLENVVIAGPDEDPEIWLLDPVGVRPLSDRRVAIVRMLDRLHIEVSDRAVPRWARMPLVRAAVGGLSRADRGAVIRHVRAIR